MEGFELAIGIWLEAHWRKHAEPKGESRQAYYDRYGYLAVDTLRLLSRLPV
jgi:hypothetical protein